VDPDVRQAQLVRSVGILRTRRATFATVVAALLMTALLTVAAAASTHSKRVVTHVVRVKRRLAPVTAPAPPLVSLEGAASTPPSTQQSAAAPAPAPAPVTPVVVSGGS
jgi:hypothetical protein